MKFKRNKAKQDKFPKIQTWDGGRGDMREIKFRAWDTWRKRMGYRELEGSVWKYNNGDDYFTMSSNSKHMYKIMQYTGLKDKNNKEIYEGDILYGRDEEADEEIFEEVIWDDDKAKFMASWKDYKIDLFLINKKDKIIGNAYENPELLENK